MKYFIDTEFLEGKQQIRIPLTNISIDETKPTIELISIGIVSEDNREYYVISKDFNLKEAWNRFDLKESIFSRVDNRMREKEYWIRDNVLKPIYYELIGKDINFHDADNFFNYYSLKRLIDRHGKTNKEIADDIIKFTRPPQIFDEVSQTYNVHYGSPKFYGYYADYDWVVFCWLFGKMINLPKGFPMYCFDLKQELDRIANSLKSFELSKLIYPNCSHNVFEGLDTGLLTDKVKLLKDSKNYPKQINEHNALDDAKWNKELYNFLNNLK